MPEGMMGRFGRERESLGLEGLEGKPEGCVRS